MKWLSRLWEWIQFFWKRDEPTKPEPIKELWVAVEGSYEKWKHPSNKNDKHYRIIFRNNNGKRRISKIKFKRASEALEYIERYNRACYLRLATAKIRTD